MTEFGYDRVTGHLFQKEEQFSYCGCFDVSCLPFHLPADFQRELIYHSPSGSFAFDRNTAEIAASAFLSCYSGGRALGIHISDGCFAFSYLFKSGGRQTTQVKVQTTLEYTRKGIGDDTVCLSGSDCLIPSRVSDVARLFPRNRVFIPSLGLASAAFGTLVLGTKEKSEQLDFSYSNDETIPDCERLSYDENIAEDCMGKMALSVSGGVYAINEVRKNVGISVFYGCLLSHVPFSRTDICLVREKDVDRYFPFEQISVKRFAGRCVPVEMNCGEEFQKDTGLQTNKAIVKVVHSQDDERLKAFMHFYEFYSGKRVVFSTDPRGIVYNRYGTIWRAKEAFRVSAEWLCKRYRE